MTFNLIVSYILLYSIFFPASVSLSNAGEQMPICSQDVFTSHCSNQYCVDPKPTTRNWYPAMAECRAYGEELVSLESPAKVQSIRDQLTGHAIGVSREFFVNAHRPFYWANDKIAWKSGEKTNLTANTGRTEECVYYFSTKENSSYILKTIECKDLVLVSLICQKNTRRIYFGSELKTLMSPSPLQFSHSQINYPREQCEYFSLVHTNFNWYQAKTYCESLNLELIGVPNKNECPLIEQAQSFNSAKISLFLNLHLYLYSSNFSFLSFKDYTGKSLAESECNFTHFLRNMVDIEDYKEFCIQVTKSTAFSSVVCSNQAEHSGFICKQCRPTNYSYTQANDRWNCEKDAPVSLSPIKEQADCHTPFLLYLCFMFLSVLFIIALTVALLLSFMRNRRARTGNSLLGDEAGGGKIDLKLIPPPLPTSCPPDSQYHLAAGEPDTGEAKALHSVAYCTGSGYRPDPTYAEPTDFDDAGFRSGGGNAHATPIASKTSSNKSYNKSGTLYLVLRVSFVRIYHFIVMFVHLLICMVLYKYSVSCVNSEQSSQSIDFSPQGSSMRRCGHCRVEILEILGCGETRRACGRVTAASAASAESSEVAAGGRDARVPRRRARRAHERQVVGCSRPPALYSLHSDYNTGACMSHAARLVLLTSPLRRCTSLRFLETTHAAVFALNPNYPDR